MIDLEGVPPRPPDPLAELWASLLPIGGWVAEAVCGSQGLAELFTADRRPDREDMAVVERVCRRCPVRAECGDYAAQTPVWGVWAGVWHDGKARPRQAA